MQVFTQLVKYTRISPGTPRLGIMDMSQHERQLLFHITYSSPIHLLTPMFRRFEDGNLYSPSLQVYSKHDHVDYPNVLHYEIRVASVSYLNNVFEVGYMVRLWFLKLHQHSHITPIMRASVQEI